MATFPSVFQEIHLTVRNRTALQCDVDAVVGILSRTEAARYVRSLSLKGCLPMESKGTGERLSGHEDQTEEAFKLTGLDEVLGDEEPLLYGWHCDHGPVEVSPEEDIAWAPVVNLVKALPYLTRLVLHHLTFRLRSLRWETPDSHEMALATSPCLYRAKVRCAWRDSNAEDDFNQEAMLQLVAGLAPNLKELLVAEVIPTLSSRGRRIPRGPWRGLPGFGPGSATGSLSSLSLIGSVDFSPDLLQTWNKHTDFSSLRHMTLGGGWDCRWGLNDEAMIWLIEHCSFPRLRTLRIRIERDDDQVERPDYVKHTITFFRAFEPLEELSVSGSLEPEILRDGILSKHGFALKKLSLCPSENPHAQVRQHIPMIFTKEHIMHIQAQCPLLQDLAVPVKRTKSDGIEAEMYKAFGKIERLQSLYLTLDCSDWRVTRDSTLTDDPSFDEDDRRLFAASHWKRGYLREAFMNCAVDESLARSIWDTICRVKEGKQLESLKLFTTGGGDFGNTSSHSDMPDFIRHLSRSWSIKRSVRDDETKITISTLDEERHQTSPPVEEIRSFWIVQPCTSFAVLGPPRRTVKIGVKIGPVSLCKANPYTCIDGAGWGHFVVSSGTVGVASGFGQAL
ncbi:hypothetical protein VSDG_07872 [Cytospora chrysosperma]|uniref:Uncharacterized protein n=1 Tax=Cytospora chrysosperma TaxID=252740 RepID=A0A423VJM4_CYTCH|nr:hypothetical protein VSDG_07872 [Valsa sordida]